MWRSAPPGRTAAEPHGRGKDAGRSPPLRAGREGNSRGAASFQQGPHLDAERRAKGARGLMSRDGIVPLGLSFDTSGPMARSITDVAVALGAMTGVDPGDSETQGSAGRVHADYTKFLDKDALKGARLGVLVDYCIRAGHAGADRSAEYARAGGGDDPLAASLVVGGRRPDRKRRRSGGGRSPSGITL
jgi:hypothetical protein